MGREKKWNIFLSDYKQQLDIWYNVALPVFMLILWKMLLSLLSAYLLVESLGQSCATNTPCRSLYCPPKPKITNLGRQAVEEIIFTTLFSATTNHSLLIFGIQHQVKVPNCGIGFHACLFKEIWPFLSLIHFYCWCLSPNYIE